MAYGSRTSAPLGHHGLMMSSTKIMDWFSAVSDRGPGAEPYGPTAPSGYGPSAVKAPSRKYIMQSDWED